MAAITEGLAEWLFQLGRQHRVIFTSEAKKVQRTTSLGQDSRSQKGQQMDSVFDEARYIPTHNLEWLGTSAQPFRASATSRGECQAQSSQGRDEGGI
jgi:hypothetical protein